VTQHIGIAPSSFSKRKLGVVALGGALAFAAATFAIVTTRGHAETPAAPARSDIPRRAGDGIEITDAFRAEMGIATTPATRSALMPVVKVVGEAAFDPRHVAAVGARASGIVRKVFNVEGVHGEGGAVRAVIEWPWLAEVLGEQRLAAGRRRAAG
jgi:hypothetical protein